MRSRTLLSLALASLLLAGGVESARAEGATEKTASETYVEGMTETMKDWADKVGDWTARQLDAAGDATARAGERTEEALDRAWDAVTEDWRELQEATDDGYEAAQRKFEESLDSLEKAWDDRDEPAPKDHNRI